MAYPLFDWVITILAKHYLLSVAAICAVIALANDALSAFLKSLKIFVAA